MPQLLHEKQIVGKSENLAFRTMKSIIYIGPQYNSQGLPCVRCLTATSSPAITFPRISLSRPAWGWEPGKELIWSQGRRKNRVWIAPRSPSLCTATMLRDGSMRLPPPQISLGQVQLASRSFIYRQGLQEEDQGLTHSSRSFLCLNKGWK